MDQPDSEHTQHYTAGDLAAAVAAALGRPHPGEMGRALAALAELDQYHTGGIEATHALARRAALTETDRVLDIGGGLGGPARTIAYAHGCQVTVLDLTEAYCRAGERLSAWAGLADRVRFYHGDALEIPFADGSFDVVWTQHSTMNIADKPGLYAEIRRVLRPGGRLAFQEVLAGPAGEPHFPTLWARTPAASFLATPETLAAILSTTGLVLQAWEETSAWAITWLAERQSALLATPDAALPAGLPRVLGPAFRTMAQNHGRNLREGRIRIVEGIAQRP